MITWIGVQQTAGHEALMRPGLDGSGFDPDSFATGKQWCQADYSEAKTLGQARLELVNLTDLVWIPRHRSAIDLK